MSWTLTISGSAVSKAGLTISDVGNSISGAILDKWSDQAESFISSLANVNCVTNYSTFTAEGKVILDDLSSDLIGQRIAVYSRKVYGSQREFETILDMLENRIGFLMELIKDDKLKTYLGAT